MRLLTDETDRRVVNVASVPQRSPVRYPGGKTWLVPWIRRWLTSLPSKARELVEPFAGGGSVALTAVFEGLVETVTMVELDAQVASVWRTMLSDDCDWLVRKVLTFDITPEAVREELARPQSGLKELAFQTLLRNRVNHGGILAPGTGLLKHGENGKGLKSRWYPQTLAKRITNIHRVKDRFHFVEGDGLEILARKAPLPDVVHFIDPPYTAAGKKAGTRLYTHNDLDHEALFQLAKTLAGDFLMTYDNAGGVLDLVHRYGFDAQAIPMMNTHHAEMTELLIGRNLNWAHPS